MGQISQIQLPIGDIVNNYKGGKSICHLAQKYHVSRYILRSRLSKNGVIIRSDRNWLRICLPLDKIKNEYLNGVGLELLAKKYNVKDNTLWYQLSTRYNIESRKKKKIPLDQIKNEYLLGFSLNKLGNKYKCSYCTIRNRLKSIGVTIRKQKKVNASIINEIKSKYLNGVSTTDLIKQYHLDRSTIWDILNKVGIRGTGPGKYKRLNINEDSLILDYMHGWGSAKLAHKYNISSSGVLKILHRNGVIVRKNSNIYTRGSYSHLWKGGISFRDYGPNFNNFLKRQIIRRDKGICQYCGNHYKICVHHIDYNKMNNIGYNLISLCRVCHAKTNSYRKLWEEYFMRLMNVKIENNKNKLIL